MRTASLLAALALGVVGTATTAQADYFGCYKDCAVPLDTDASCKEGVSLDYDISTVDRGSSVTVLSFHGGNIELDTTEIARTAADRNGWNRYNFAGHGRSSCLGTLSNFEKLHITAVKFNEPRALDLVRKYARAVSIHGFSSSS